MRSRRAAVVMVVSLLASVVLGGCGDEPKDTGPEPTTTTNPVPQETRAKQLLRDLAEKGQADLFEQQWVATFDDGAAVYVAIKDDLAIGYFCDPHAGSAWFSGSHDYGQIQMIGPSGASLHGSIVVKKFTADLRRTVSHAGELRLRRQDEARITRERLADDTDSKTEPAGMIVADGAPHSCPTYVP